MKKTQELTSENHKKITEEVKKVTILNSLLSIFLSYEKFKYSEKAADILPKEIYNEFVEMIETDLSNIKNILNTQISEREEIVDRFMEKVNLLGKMYRESRLYFLHISFLQNYEFFLLTKNTSKSFEVPSSYRKEVLFDIEDYLADCEESDLKNKSSQLMAAFPICMTREKYYDYIKTVFDFDSEESEQTPADRAKEINMQLFPFAFPEYGESFPEVAAKLKVIENDIMCGKIDDDPIGNILNDLRKILELTDVLDTYFKSFTSLLEFLEKWDDFFKNEPEIEKILIKSSNVTELDHVSLLTCIAQYGDEIKNKTNMDKFKKTNKKLFDKAAESYSGEDSTLETGASHEKIKSHLHRSTSDSVDSEESETEYANLSTADYIINFIKEQTSKTPIKLVKLIRQFSFSVMPAPDDEFLLRYFKDNIDNLDDSTVFTFKTISDSIMYEDS
ncbi:MAG: hypothetical protein LBS21_08990 [Clostridiales bacterium]|nr:hypothetical protein [Clostridiales bacterium]